MISNENKLSILTNLTCAHFEVTREQINGHLRGVYECVGYARTAIIKIAFSDNIPLEVAGRYINRKSMSNTEYYLAHYINDFDLFCISKEYNLRIKELTDGCSNN